MAVKKRKAPAKKRAAAKKTTRNPKNIFKTAASDKKYKAAKKRALDAGRAASKAYKEAVRKAKKARK